MYFLKIPRSYYKDTKNNPSYLLFVTVSDLKLSSLLIEFIQKMLSKMKATLNNHIYFCSGISVLNVIV